MLQEVNVVIEISPQSSQGTIIKRPVYVQPHHSSFLPQEIPTLIDMVNDPMQKSMTGWPRASSGIAKGVEWLHHICNVWGQPAKLNLA
jgi:hypothetical protein